MKFSIFASILVLVGTWLNSAYAAASSSTSILTLDAAGLFNGYWKVQEEQKKLQQAEEKATRELQDMYDKGVELMAQAQAAAAQAGNPALTEEAREQKAKEAKELQASVQQKETDFREYQQQVNRNLTQQQENLMKIFADDVEKISEAVRQERGAVAVFNKAGSMVVTADPQVDITDVVLKRLNATKPKADSTTAASKPPAGKSSNAK